MSWIFEFRPCRGYRYLYIVQKARVPGKGPRNVRQIYIGTADTLYRRLTAGPQGLHLRTFPFGREAALLYAARRTGLLPALERALPLDGKTAQVAARLIFLQVLGRTERPLSRRKMQRWYPQSGLSLYWPVPYASDRSMLSALRLLFGTDQEDQDGETVLTRARVHRIEEEVFRSLLALGMEMKYLLFDGTNFFTYHRGVRGELFEYGRNKQKRFDLRQVGMGLATMEDLPVLSEVTPGNLGDPETFTRAFDALVKRLEHLEVATEKLTLVFDRGVNSTDNFDDVLGAMHVIAALDRPQAQKLFVTPVTEFRPVSKDSHGAPVLGYSTRWEGFGRDWRVLVTYRPVGAKAEEADWKAVRTKVLGKIAKLRSRRPSTKKKVVVNQLADAIPKVYRGLFDYEVEEIEVERNGKKVKRYRPRCEVDPRKEATLTAAFGKTAVITDLAEGEAPDGEIVRGWVLRTNIEEEFKWLKDRYVVSVKPVWVWHEAAVPGHIFLCVMGLMLLRYLQSDVRQIAFLRGTPTA